jgi:protease-4
MSDDTRLDGAHSLLAADRYRRARGFWRLLAFLAFGALILALIGRFAFGGGPSPDRIARIVLDGTITTNPTRVRVIDDLIEDDAVKAVIVAINSPGGTSAGGEEIFEALMRLRAEKPVVAVVHELAASGGYMAAIGTDRIYTRRLSIVGSIGVFYQHVNAGGLLDSIGVDLERVASGPLKGRPEFDEPITPEVRASLEDLVNSSYAWFVDIVAERRGINRAQALRLADGRVFSGADALEAGLVDAVGGETEAIAWLETEREIAEDLPVITAYPKSEPGMGWLSRWLVHSAVEALGVREGGALPLDGLVSLWQVDLNG